MEDGWITIGTELSTDKFDKQIADLEKKMQKEENKKIEYNTEINLREEQIQKAEVLFEKLPKSIDKVNMEMLELAKQMDSLKIDSPEFQSAEQKMQELQIKAIAYEDIWKRLPNEITRQEGKIENLKNKHQEINQKISEYKQKIEGVKVQRQVSDVEKLKSGFNSVGSSIQNSIKNVARLALGIFGIRTAINVLSRASSNLASYDQQYAANIEYIRYALTQMIAPVLQWIVRLAATLLGYINAILQGWFGINLFSRGSAKNFNKMKAGASGVSKAVKEIKKQLAGFDEMNVLQSNSSSGSGGGVGGVPTPSFDLSSLQGEPPVWLKWIIDNKDLILSVLAGIAGALVAWKLGLSLIKSLGIGLMIAGVIYAIQGLIKYLKDPSWKNFGKIIQGIGVAVIGLGLLIGGLPVILTGAVVLIMGTIIKYWERIKAYLQQGINWLKGKSDWVHSMFGKTIGNIYDMFVKNLQLILNSFNSRFTMLKGIFDGLIKFIKGVFTGNWKQAWQGIRQIFSSVWQGIMGIFTAKLSIMRNMVFTIASTTGNIISSVFKAVVNAVLRTIERVLNTPIRTINSLIGTINEVPGIHLRHLNTFNLPRLKSGGIINMPNKGTMVGGSAIGGESGREGVVPLTDQQAMAELGREIGKNVLVNLTNITSMNGRVISRELKQIQSGQDFAYNT